MLVNCSWGRCFLFCFIFRGGGAVMGLGHFLNFIKPLLGEERENKNT